MARDRHHHHDQRAGRRHLTPGMLTALGAAPDPPRTCDAADCDKETPTPGRRHCLYHERRLRNYGTTDADTDILQYNAPGVPQERVDELKAMPWEKLVAYCDALRNDPSVD